MLTIAYVLVVMRLVVRVALKQRHLVLSDVFLVVGALCALGIVICDTISYRMGAMDDYNMTGTSVTITELGKACCRFPSGRPPPEAKVR